MCVYPPCAGLLIGLFRLDLLPITPVLRVFCTFSPKFDYFGENVQKTRSTGVIGNKSVLKVVKSPKLASNMPMNGPIQPTLPKNNGVGHYS